MPWQSNLPALRLLLAYTLHEPSSLLPHTQIPTLLSRPRPRAPSLSQAVTFPGKPKIPITIRALVLDKDNTFCPPNSTALHPAYLLKLSKIRSSPEFASNPHSILIVSNTAGSTPSPAHEAEAQLLESELQIPVLRQNPQRKKPHCGPDVLEYFSKHGVTDNPAEIAVVGDRLATDVLLAREMGSWSVWVRDGWRNPEMQGRDYRGWMSKMEARAERFLRGGMMYKAPLPRGFMGMRGGDEKV
jgi:phosphatidylglycerophosphatase GEP4